MYQREWNDSRLVSPESCRTHRATPAVPRCKRRCSLCIASARQTLPTSLIACDAERLRCCESSVGSWVNRTNLGAAGTSGPESGLQTVQHTGEPRAPEHAGIPTTCVRSAAAWSTPPGHYASLLLGVAQSVLAEVPPRNGTALKNLCQRRLSQGGLWHSIRHVS